LPATISPRDSRVASASQIVPHVGIDVGLTQDAAQGADRDLGLSWDNGGIDGLALSPDELDVATSLTGFDESRRLEPALDFAERRGLSRANFNLDCADLRRPGGLRRFEMQLQRFLQIRKRFFLGLSLAGDVDIKTLGNVPFAFSPDPRRE
jgi:hypothetical protein